MSEAVPDRGSMRFLAGALVCLRALLVIASLGVSASPVLAQVCSMPQGCVESMAQADVPFAMGSNVGVVHQSPHQMTCSLPGCLAADPTGTLSEIVTSDLRAAVSVVAEDVFGAGRVIAPGRRPPIAFRL